MIDGLREALSSLELAHESLQSFTGLPEMSHGFFPGGAGLWAGVADGSLPREGSTLILGSNFGLASLFVDEQGSLLTLDERETSPTWKKLLPLLRAAEIDVNQCFFTNAWPFLHRDGTNLGPVDRWLQDKTLMRKSIEFFELTVSTIRPHLIVALGTGPAAFLGHAWPDRLGSWKGYSISCLDDTPMATVPAAHNNDVVCVAITHPSMPNSWRRRQPYQHRLGEIQLIREAFARTGSIRFCELERPVGERLQ